MVKIIYNGRLGNNLIQYFAAYFFSKKFNFELITQPKTNYGDLTFLFDIKNPIGINGLSKYIVNDQNFIDLYQSNTIDKHHYVFDGYFQFKDFFTPIQNEIKSYLKNKNEPKKPNEVFVHYRIGDIINDRRMLPYEYYDEALSNISFNNGFLCSDSIDHPFCKKLIEKYNLKPIFNYNPLEIINFGKNFDNLVLSEGTFSWWIGYLSDAKNIIHNRRNYFWHGDIFLEKWTKLSWDYDHNSIYDRIKLINYKPIKLNVNN